MRLHPAFLVAAALTAAHAITASAQSIAERVGNVHDATVELRFAGRRGLCGDGRHYLSFGGAMRMGEFGGDRWRDDACLPGPVRVRLRVVGDVVREVRAYVGPVVALPEEGMVVNVGVVPAAEAARYFLGLAASGDGRAAAKAILPAVLADSASVWRGLVAIARDASRPRAARTDAAFWLSRFAAAKGEGHGEDLSAIEREEHPDDDPRFAAVFALSQLRNGEGIPPLISVARTNRDPLVRRQALFWLGQSADPRGIEVMAEMLAR